MKPQVPLSIRVDPLERIEANSMAYLLGLSLDQLVVQALKRFYAEDAAEAHERLRDHFAAAVQRSRKTMRRSTHASTAEQTEMLAGSR